MKRFEFLFRLILTILRTYEKKIIKLQPPEAVAFLKWGFQEGCKLHQNAKLLRAAWKLSFDKNSILFELPWVSHLRLRLNQFEFMPLENELLSGSKFSVERHYEKINIDNCWVKSKSLDDALRGCQVMMAQLKKTTDRGEYATKSKNKCIKGSLTPISTREDTPDSIEQTNKIKSLSSFTTEEITSTIESDK